MDVTAVLRVIVRRWKVVVAVLILTALAAFVVSTRVEPEYQANAVVLLAGSQQADDVVANSQLASPAIIAEVVQGDAVRSRLDSSVPYTVEVVGEGSILRVTASAPDDDDAIVDTVNEVMGAIESQVDQRQADAGVPAELRVRTQILAVPGATRAETIEDSDGSTSTRYSTSGSILLSAPDVGAANSYGPNEFTLRVLQARSQSPEVATMLRERGATASYAVGFQNRDPAPLLELEVTGTTSDEVINTLQLLITMLQEELDQRQAAGGVTSEARTSVEELSVPSVAARSSSTLLRPLVAIGGLGFAAALALAIFTESMSQSWSRRRARPTEGAIEDTDSTLPDRPQDLEMERLMDEYSPSGPEGRRRRG